ncbi:MAG TPA: phosphoglucosamine mutase [Kiritimatiellia bacterium]|jgi:phosphoglucosamine mutase|nr:MAG: Phosphoglucosamine mutase [Verrucomicrobia bacterium ADurb.Bin018]HOD99493.1 phosphoglucosamine mutase [Kiritimatiellia bacterium]HOE37262.1 phosphoglucosamine mutase [Kiritimatiellia bacterium]HOR73414.1 phosphoglucosamine mutase [Kiritimatiellia bacterium]HOU58507.1 phosphoglucosamine mutase [Kiritimatiellia bacterium]
MGENKLFGTDGVRGVANREPMMVETAVNLARAVAYVLKERKGGKRPRVVIGKDTRLSGYMLENALVAGLCSMGGDALLVGTLPTPGIAVLVRDQKADAGFVISASHNPFQDNGIKLFSADGYKLPDEEETAIENLLAGGKLHKMLPKAGGIGKSFRVEDALERYTDFCVRTFPADMDLKGLRLVLDCGNGATYKAAPAVFKRLGASVTTLHNTPNGLNINARCGSQHTEALREQVLAERADVGLAFDGDGDRLIVVDETGVELTGDHVLAICAKDLKERGKLRNNLAVGTVMSNFGLHTTMRKLGIELACSAVGDRYVLDLMKERGSVIGAEASGHMIFLEQHTTGDGIVSGLQLLAVLRRSGQEMSTLASILQLAPQRLVNVDVAQRPPLETLPTVQAAIQAAEKELGQEGRVFVRYSGTQAMCRVMVEGPTDEMTDRLCHSIATAVKQAIG